jgi:hypothetical protein
VNAADFLENVLKVGDLRPIISCVTQRAINQIRWELVALKNSALLLLNALQQQFSA